MRFSGAQIGFAAKSEYIIQRRARPKRIFCLRRFILLCVLNFLASFLSTIISFMTPAAPCCTLLLGYIITHSLTRDFTQSITNTLALFTAAIHFNSQICHFPRPQSPECHIANLFHAYRIHIYVRGNSKFNSLFDCELKVAFSFDSDLGEQMLISFSGF